MSSEIQVLGGMAGADVACIFGIVRGQASPCAVCGLSVLVGSLVVVLAESDGISIAHLDCVGELESLSAFTRRVDTV